MEDRREKEFANGLLAKAPHENSPDFVKAKLSVNKESFIAWLHTKTEAWVNLDVKVAKSGKWYAEVDNFKPTKAAKEAKNHDANYTLETKDAYTEDEIPF